MRGHDPLNCGIYSITNTVTGKLYIGSASNFDERWRVHRVHLSSNNHHSKHLQSSWNKHGAAAFQFKKLLVCAQHQLTMYEQLLIDGHRSADREHGYNARPVAESMLGYKHTPETREKLSAARKGQVFSEETRALWSKNRTGRKMPDWFPEFTRQHKTGTKHSDATKAIISAKGIGRPCSVQTRERRSKVTLDQVEQIKSMAISGRTYASIATEFALDPSTISLIARGKRWAIQPLTNQENHHG